ncbi:ctenidin-1-like [Ooceraea biroi]|nr:ctenidin-1-like [Ooceraea biroi]
MVPEYAMKVLIFASLLSVGFATFGHEHVHIRIHLPEMVQHHDEKIIKYEDHGGGHGGGGGGGGDHHIEVTGPGDIGGHGGGYGGGHGGGYGGGGGFGGGHGGGGEKLIILYYNNYVIL